MLLVHLAMKPLLCLSKAVGHFQVSCSKLYDSVSVQCPWHLILPFINVLYNLSIFKGKFFLCLIFSLSFFCQSFCWCTIICLWYFSFLKYITSLWNFPLILYPVCTFFFYFFICCYFTS
jgi:hypothetical protein